MADDDNFALRISQAQMDLNARQSMLHSVIGRVGMAAPASGYYGNSPQNELAVAIDQLCQAHARAQVYQIMSTQNFYHCMMMSAGATK